MKTPCVQICRVVDNMCVGCMRTLEQIANWTQYTDLEREQIITTNAGKVFTDTHESSKLE